MASRLRTRVIWKAFRPQFRKRAREGNVLGMFACADSNCSMAIFQTNLAWFMERGLMERALLLAWNNQKHTILWREWMKLYLQISDRQRLLQASDALPPGDRFTVYRGVGDSRDEFEGQPIGGMNDGVSWTFNIETARRFAGNLGMAGRVLAIDIKREEIYAYLGHSDSSQYRPEEEVLLIITDPTRIRVHEVVEESKDGTNG